MATEQRASARPRVLRRARIVFNRGQCVIDCVMLDLSPQGARLRLGAWQPLPDRFELRMENGVVHDARACFRRPGEIGIEFVEQRPVCSPSGSSIE